MGADAQDMVLRLDKWLWYARFFKTRSASTKAISGGRFRLDGIVMDKPHRQALCGQILTFIQGDRVRVIKIMALGSRRGPASEASVLYEDLTPAHDIPAKMEKAKQPEFEARSKGSGRPTKLQRRATDWLKAKINDSGG
ncbi:MAG: RNA-binding S4 domain-containing protein [Candidatus Puniceispirillaceae bacterium]